MSNLSRDELVLHTYSDIPVNPQVMICRGTNHQQSIDSMTIIPRQTTAKSSLMPSSWVIPVPWLSLVLTDNSKAAQSIVWVQSNVNAKCRFAFLAGQTKRCYTCLYSIAVILWGYNVNVQLLWYITFDPVHRNCSSTVFIYLLSSGYERICALTSTCGCAVTWWTHVYFRI